MPPQYIGAVFSCGVSPSSSSASSGRKRSSPGLSRMPLPRVLTTVTAPRRSTSTSPTTPSRESARRSSGSAYSASTRRSTTSTRLSVPSERIHSLPSRTTRSALSTKREAQHAGQVRLVERGLGVDAGTEHHHDGFLGGLGRGVDERQPQRLRPRRRGPRADALVEVGDGVRHHAAVGHCVAGPRRRLRPVGVDQELAGRGAADVAAVQEQLMAPWHLDAAGGAHVSGMAEHQLRRQRAAGDRPARPVEVGQHGVEQSGALHQTGLEDVPVGRRDQQRQRVQMPRAGHPPCRRRW